MKTLSYAQHSPSKAAIYCRVALSRQINDDTIISQRNILRDYAEQQGFPILSVARKKDKGLVSSNNFLFFP